MITYDSGVANRGGSGDTSGANQISDEAIATLALDRPLLSSPELDVIKTPWTLSAQSKTQRWIPERGPYIIMCSPLFLMIWSLSWSIFTVARKLVPRNSQRGYADMSEAEECECLHAQLS